MVKEKEFVIKKNGNYIRLHLQLHMKENITTLNKAI